VGSALSYFGLYSYCLDYHFGLDCVLKLYSGVLTVDLWCYMVWWTLSILVILVRCVILVVHCTAAWFCILFHC